MVRKTLKNHYDLSILSAGNKDHLFKKTVFTVLRSMEFHEQATY